MTRFPSAGGSGAPLKVMLTVHQFFPDFSSGTEVLTLAVARELVARGHEVRVMTGFPETRPMTDDARCDEYVFEGMRIHRFRHAHVRMGNQVSKIEIGFDNQLAAKYFRKVIDEFRPDLVHFFHLHRLGTGLIDQAVEAGVRSYFTPTDFWAICPTGQLLNCDDRRCSGPSARAGNCVLHLAANRLGGVVGRAVAHVPASAGDLLVRLTHAGLLTGYPEAVEVAAVGRRLPFNVSRLNLLQRIIAPNRMMEELLLRHGVDARRVVVSRYGVEVPKSDAVPAPAPAPDPSRPLRVGFIGTLAHHKGCHVLIRAFNSLPPGRATLRIYGSESDFPDYAKALRELAGESLSVEFCGVFPNGAIGQVFADLDVLAVPSVWNENTPLVIYSAQACRCPVVGSDVPGIAEVVRDGIDGLLFSPGSPDALAGQLRRLIDRPEVLRGLREQVSAPKSVAEYVDELVGFWQDDQ